MKKPNPILWSVNHGIHLPISWLTKGKNKISISLSHKWKNCSPKIFFLINCKVLQKIYIYQKPYLFLIVQIVYIQIFSLLFLFGIFIFLVDEEKPNGHHKYYCQTVYVLNWCVLLFSKKYLVLLKLCCFEQFYWRIIF